MLSLSEQGLYFFLGRSDKASALPMQMWLAGEVLPSIRRTGGYALSNATGIDRADRTVVGGIVKAVTTKAIAENAPAIIREMLPDLLAAEMAGHHFQLVDRVSATEVSELAGYPDGRRPRGLAQFVSRRLTRFHEDRGLPVRRSRHGIRRVKLFDESASRLWLNSGGKVEMDRYVAERFGQGKLRLAGK